MNTTPAYIIFLGMLLFLPLLGMIMKSALRAVNIANRPYGRSVMAAFLFECAKIVLAVMQRVIFGDNAYGRSLDLLGGIFRITWYDALMDCVLLAISGVLIMRLFSTSYARAAVVSLCYLVSSTLIFATMFLIVLRVVGGH